MNFIRNISYCPENVTIHDIWINHGLSHCFLDTVSSSVIAGFIFIFGTIQLCIYRKYATPIEDLTQISNSKLYYLQMFLLTLVPALSVVRFILESFVFPDAQLYGYTVNLLFNIQTKIKNKKFSCCFADFGRLLNVFFVPFFYVADFKRTLLPVALRSIQRTRLSIVNILDTCFYK